MPNFTIVLRNPIGYLTGAGKSEVTIAALTRKDAQAAALAEFRRMFGPLSPWRLDDSERDEPYHVDHLGPAAFLEEVLAEVHRATTKLPDPAGNLTALTEEVGELAQAMMDRPAAAVRAEAVQVAAMALRCALQGDPLLDAIRFARGAETDLPARRKAEKAEAKRLAAAKAENDRAADAADAASL